MRYLIAVSMIWSLSFGLISVRFGGVDSNLLGFARLAIALPFFLPFLQLSGLPLRTLFSLLAIGAVQYGLMYAALFHSFKYLQGHEVALLTVFTPFYVVIFHSLFSRSWNSLFYLSALLALAGGAWIYLPAEFNAPLTGILWMQVSNAAFALGQVWYVRCKPAERSDLSLYAIPFAGAVSITALATTFSSGWSGLLNLDSAQWITLVYLGAVASGLCFFWWNKGATQVNSGALAAMNNLKIPLAVLISVLVFQEQASLIALVGGAFLILSGIYAATRGKSMNSSQHNQKSQTKAVKQL